MVDIFEQWADELAPKKKKDEPYDRERSRGLLEELELTSDEEDLLEKAPERVPDITDEMTTVEKTRLFGRQIIQAGGQGLADIARGTAMKVEREAPEVVGELLADEESALRLLEDTGEIDYLPDELEGESPEKITRYLVDEQQKFLKTARDFAADMPEVEPGRPFGLFSDAVVGFSRSAPAMSLMLVPGVGPVGTAAMTGAIFVQLAGQKYDEKKKEGKSDEVAYNAAVLHATMGTPIELAGNVIQIRALKGVLSSTFKKMGLGPRITALGKATYQGMKGEGLEETGQAATEVVADVYAEKPDAPVKELVKDTLSIYADPEWQKSAVRAGITGAIGGGILPVGGALLTSPFSVADYLRERAAREDATKLGLKEQEEAKVKEIKLPTQEEEAIPEAKPVDLFEEWAEEIAPTPTPPVIEKAAPRPDLEAEAGRDQIELAESGPFAVGMVAEQVAQAEEEKRIKEQQKVQTDQALEQARATKEATEQAAVAEEQRRAEEAEATIVLQEQAAIEAENTRFMTAMAIPETAMPEINQTVKTYEADPDAKKLVKPVRAMHKALDIGIENVDKLRSLVYDMGIQAEELSALDPKFLEVNKTLNNMAGEKINELELREAGEILAKEKEKLAKKAEVAKPVKVAEKVKAAPKAKEPTAKKAKKVSPKKPVTAKAEKPAPVKVAKKGKVARPGEPSVSEITPTTKIDGTTVGSIEDKILAKKSVSKELTEALKTKPRTQVMDWLNPGEVGARLAGKMVERGTAKTRKEAYLKIAPQMKRYQAEYDKVMAEKPAVPEEAKARIAAEKQKRAKPHLPVHPPGLKKGEAVTFTLTENGQERRGTIFKITPTTIYVTDNKDGRAYKVSRGGEIRYSRRGKVTVQDLNRVFEKVKLQLAKQVKVYVLASSHGLRSANAIAYAQMTREKVHGKVGALYDSTTSSIYVFADMYTNTDAAIKDLWHELYHGGIRSVLGPDLNPLLDRVRSKYSGEIKKRIKKYGYDNTVENRRREAEEIVVEKAVDGTDVTIMTKLIDLLKQLAKKLGFTNVITESEIKKLIKAMHTDLTRMPKDAVPKASPWKGVRYVRKFVQKKVHIRENLPDEMRTYEVSMYPGELAKITDQKTDINIKTVGQARKINANPERVADWKAIYDKATKMDKWADVQKVNKDGKLKTVQVVSLTKGCQRTRAIVERVENGILPQETRIEACFGGDCWVNKQFNRLFKVFENMEVRDLKLATAEQMKFWLKSKSVQKKLKDTPFIRQGQQGDDSHLFASGVAFEWLKALKDAKIMSENVFISAGYAPVTDAQYKELAQFKDQFVIHFSNSGWFHKNEILLRLAEFQAAKKAGLRAKIRMVTNEENVGGINMPNQDFLLKQMKTLGVQQSEVLETPFHKDDAAGKPRSKPSRKFKHICCETGACRTCSVKCMTAVDPNVKPAASYSRMDVEEGTVEKGKAPAKKKYTAARPEQVKQVLRSIIAGRTRFPEVWQTLKNMGIKWTVTAQKPVHGNKKAIASYDPNAKLITFYAPNVYFEKYDTELTLTHEGLHGVITERLWGKASDVGARAVFNIKMRRFLKELKGHVDKTTPKRLVEILKVAEVDDYHLQEIVTYGFTEPKFAQWLQVLPASNQIPRAKTTKTLWDRFKEIMGAVVGLHKTKFDELSEIMDYVIPWEEGTALRYARVEEIPEAARYARSQDPVQLPDELITDEVDPADIYDSQDFYAGLRRMQALELKHRAYDMIESPDDLVKFYQKENAEELDALTDRIISRVKEVYDNWLRRHDSGEGWVEEILDASGEQGIYFNPSSAFYDNVVGVMQAGSWRLNVEQEVLDAVNAMPELAEEMEGYEFTDGAELGMELDAHELGWDSPIGQTVLKVMETAGWKAWQNNWGHELTDAENRIRDQRQRLRTAKTIDEKVLAINLALNEQHVYGSMGEHLDLSEDELDELATMGNEVKDLKDLLTRKYQYAVRYSREYDKAREYVGVHKKPEINRNLIGMSWWDKFIAHGMDSAKALMKIEPKGTSAEMSGYVAHNLMSNFPAIMHSIMYDGKPQYANHWIKVTPESEGGLFDVWSRLGDDAEHFFNRLTAKSAQEMLNKKRTHLFGQNEQGEWLDDQAIVNDLMAGTEELYQKNKKEWDKAETRLHEINTAMLDFAERANIINAEQRKEWERDYYIPFYRVMSDDWLQDKVSTLFPKGGGHLIGTVHKLKGSAMNIGDPLLNLVNSYSFLMNESLKNLARIKSMRFAKELGAIEKVPGTQKDRDDVISIRVMGEPQYFKILDSYLLDALVEIDVMTGGRGSKIVSDIFAGAKKAVTFTVTSSPAFRAANFFRDTLHTAFMDKSFIGILDAGKGFYHSMLKTKQFKEFASIGGAFTGTYHQRDITADTAKGIKTLKKGLKKSFNVLNPLDYAKFGYMVYQRIGEASENANRMRRYLKGIRRGESELEAAYQAKDLLDFHRRGKNTILRAFTHSVPFLGARIQGLYKIGRTATNQETRVNFWVHAVALALAASLLHFHNEDDERYRELPDHEKLMYWHIFDVPGLGHVRLPKPFEVGVLFASMPEALWETAKGDRSVKDFMSYMRKAFTEIFQFDPRNVALTKPVLTQLTNKDPFTGAPVIPEGQKSIAAEAQIGPRTSKVAQEIGKVTKISPRRIDKVMQDYFTWVAALTAYEIDMVLDWAMEYPEDPAERLGDMYLTGVGRFARGPDWVQPYTKYNEKFYDYFTEMDEANATYNHYKKLKLKKKAKEWRKERKVKIQLARRMHNWQKQISRINTKIKVIHASAKYSAEEKRKKIDKLIIKRKKIMRKAVEKIERKLEKG